MEEFSIQSTPFEEYWHQLPPMQKQPSSTTLSVQGHSFQGRMAVLKYLIYEMNDDSTRLWGENHEWHWLWGYSSQLDWQHRSGRLAFGGNIQSDNDDLISTDSWWNYMNFCFSVCILLGAYRSGVLNGIEEIQLDPASQELVDNDKAVQECISAWQGMFEMAYPRYASIITKKNVTIPSNEYGNARFQLQQQIWTAHTQVICRTIGNASDAASCKSLRAAKLLQLLPTPEQEFGLGWCRMVEIIAACTFPTDLVSLLQDGAGFLPLTIVTPTCLQEWQTASNLSEPEAKRWKSVQATHKLLVSSRESVSRMASICQRIVRSNTVSRSMPATIQLLSHGSPSVKLQQLGRLLYLFIRPRGMLEWSIVAAMLTIVPMKRALSSMKN